MAWAGTLQTATINFNAGNYAVVDIDLGDPVRQEVWIEPMNSVATPTLAARIDRKTLMTITLRVKGSTTANLVANVKAVRDEFWNVSNTITYAIGSGVATLAIPTYPSPIASPIGQGRNAWTAAHGRLVIPAWTFQVWRHPYVASVPVVV